MPETVAIYHFLEKKKETNIEKLCVFVYVEVHALQLKCHKSDRLGQVKVLAQS